MKTVKVQKLTPEAFAKFGKVICTQDREHETNPGVHDWYVKQASIEGCADVSINLLTVKERENVVKKFERHEHTKEVCFPLTGGIVVPCLPAGEVTLDRLEAFYVPAGMGLCFDENVWHFAPHPLSGEVVCAIIFRHGTSFDDLIFEELPEEAGFTL